MISKRKPPRRSRHGIGSKLDDPRLIAAVKEYQVALESGRPPVRAEFLSRHVEFAADLIPCLASLELVHQVAARMRIDAGDPPITFAAELIPLPLVAHSR